MISSQKINILLEKVLESNSVNCMEEGFADLCQNYCIERFALARFSNNGKNFNLFHTYPLEWINHYQKNEYYKSDPVFDMVMMNNVPFFWNGNKCDNLAAEKVKIYQEAQDFGVKMGFTIPLFHSEIHQSSLTILDNLHLHPEALYSVITGAQFYLDKIGVLSQQSNETLSSNNQNAKGQESLSRLMVNGVSLTPRESECLIFIMRGYTAKEIGKSMNVSSRTVECHLDNIKEKTGYLTKSRIIDSLLCNTYNKPILQRVLEL